MSRWNAGRSWVMSLTLCGVLVLSLGVFSRVAPAQPVGRARSGGTSWQQAADGALTGVLTLRISRNPALQLATSRALLTTARREAEVLIQQDAPGAPPEGVLHALDAAARTLDAASQSNGSEARALLEQAASQIQNALQAPPRPPLPDPALVLNPGNIHFDDVCVGDAPSRTFVLTNTNTTVAHAITGTFKSRSGAYTMTPPLPSAMLPGASVTFTVIFKPTKTGEDHASLHLEDNTSGDEFLLNVSGTGDDVFIIEPVVPNFGSVAVGQSKDLTFQIKNCSANTLTVKVSSPKDPVFQLVVPPLLPTTLAPHASAPVTVRFTPTEPGKAVQTQIPVAVTVPGVKGKHKHNVLPFGKSPLEIGVDPGALDFGTVPVNEFKMLTFTLTNNTAQAQVVRFDLSMVDDTFIHFQETGPFTLAPGQQHEVNVSFMATGKCKHKDTLILKGDGFTQEKIPITAATK